MEVGTLTLGHGVTVDDYLLARVENPTVFSTSGRIKVVGHTVVDGNGRVLALQIVDPVRLILVERASKCLINLMGADAPPDQSSSLPSAGSNVIGIGRDSSL